MKEFDVKDIIRFLNFISKNGIYVCSSQDLFNDIKFPFERKNFVSIISIISNRLLKPLSREIEYSLTCPRKPFRASLSPSLEVYTSNTGRKYRDRFILSCTRNRQRIQPRRGALNRSSKLIAHVIGHFITSITGDIQGIVYKYFFSAHSTESNKFIRTNNSSIGWTAPWISFLRARSVIQNGGTGSYLWECYLLVRHYRIVCRKTFVINKWYTCIRDYGRYIPSHTSSPLPALPPAFLFFVLPHVVWQSRQFTLTRIHVHVHGEPCATCLA